MMTDPIADMLTRIRNAHQRQREFVEMPVSKMRIAISEALKQERFIRGARIVKSEPFDLLRIDLRYLPSGEGVIHGLKRVSRPGRRVYVGKDDIPVVKGGMGVGILSTPKGILTDRMSRKENTGGELLCFVW